MNDKYRIFNKDSLDFIKEIRTDSVDFIFTDPPYNLSSYSTGNIKFSHRSDINNDIANWDEGFNPDDYKDDFLRILKPNGNLFVFTSYNTIGRWHDIFDSIFDTFQFFIWHKTNPTPKFKKAGFLNSCEMIACMWNKGHTWNFMQQNTMHNFFASPICMGAERLQNPKHPTQKPVKLLRHIIQIASNEDDVIFDPFMGVGSTGVAALQLNRRFMGIEIDTTYFNAAAKRLESLT